MLQAIRRGEDSGPDLPPLPDRPWEERKKKVTVIIFLSRYALIFFFLNKTVHAGGETSLS